MFGKKTESKPQGRIDSLIGAGTQVDGNVTFSGGLRVDGCIKGNVSAADAASAATLVLSEHGRIEGDVSVAHLVTNGQIVGKVVVSEFLEMLAHAKIVGDVDYASIEMHQGAVIDAGRLLYRPKSELAEEQNTALPD